MIVFFHSFSSSLCSHESHSSINVPAFPSASNSGRLQICLLTFLVTLLIQQPLYLLNRRMRIKFFPEIHILISHFIYLQGTVSRNWSLEQSCLEFHRICECCYSGSVRYLASEFNLLSLLFRSVV